MNAHQRRKNHRRLDRAWALMRDLHPYPSIYGPSKLPMRWNENRSVIYLPEPLR